MSKPELGDKQICPSCASKFYDLTRRPAVCPKCKTAFDPADETIKLKRVRARPPVYETEAEEEEEVDAKPVESDEEEVEDTPELDEAVADAPELIEDDEEEPVVAEDDALPEGFSEDTPDLDEEVAAEEEEDDSVPMLEDDEEFEGDELGEISDEEDEPGR